MKKNNKHKKNIGGDVATAARIIAARRSGDFPKATYIFSACGTRTSQDTLSAFILAASCAGRFDEAQKAFDAPGVDRTNATVLTTFFSAANKVGRFDLIKRAYDSAGNSQINSAVVGMFIASASMANKFDEAKSAYYMPGVNRANSLVVGFYIAAACIANQVDEAKNALALPGVHQTGQKVLKGKVFLEYPGLSNFVAGMFRHNAVDQPASDKGWTPWGGLDSNS